MSADGRVEIAGRAIATGSAELAEQFDGEITQGIAALQAKERELGDKISSLPAPKVTHTPPRRRQRPPLPLNAKRSADLTARLSLSQTERPWALVLPPSGGNSIHGARGGQCRPLLIETGPASQRPDALNFAQERLLFMP